MGEAISLKVGKKKVYMTPSAAETQGRGTACGMAGGVG